MKLNRKPIPYDKYSFLLSVLGFVGSISFYIGVLRDFKEKDPHKELVEELRNENDYLKHQITDLQKQHSISNP